MEQKLYHRERYLQRLRPFYHDDDIIKVITGVRRCGKSCLMATAAEELRESGVAEKDVLCLDLDSKRYRKVATPDQLEEAIDALVSDEDPKYLFIDEVQNVDGFEEVVNAYRNDGGFSVFLTGSNSYLLSGELATKLTGRYVEAEMFTLGFSEHLGMKGFLGQQLLPDAQEFERWLSFGDFPRALSIVDTEAKDAYVRDVVDQIFEKDIRGRKKIRNRIAFERAMSYAINNFGATTNLTNIVAYLGNCDEHQVQGRALPDGRGRRLPGRADRIRRAGRHHRCERDARREGLRRGICRPGCADRDHRGRRQHRRQVPVRAQEVLLHAG